MVVTTNEGVPREFYGAKLVGSRRAPPRIPDVLIPEGGVLQQEAIHKGEAAGSDDCPVKMKLVAAPLYVLNTHILDKDQGIRTLNKAIRECREAIELKKDSMTVKEAPRVVTEREDKLLAERMARLDQENEELTRMFSPFPWEQGQP